MQGKQSPLCEVVRRNESLMRLVCGEPDEVIFTRMKRQLRPITGICEGGLMRLFVPIVRDGRLQGAVSACSLIPRDENIDLYGVSRQFNISEEDLQSLVGTSPYKTEEEIQELAEEIYQQLNAQPER